MFGFRTEIHLQIPDGIAPIGHKHDLLMYLRALRFQDFKQASLWFLIVLVDEGENLGADFGLHAFAGNDFEPAFGSGFLIRRVDITAVQTGHQVWPRRRLFRPIVGITFNELEPLFT